MSEATIRLQTLDGGWEVLGADRLRGIAAENIEAAANEWGPDTLTFEVKAVDPTAARPDLLPFTPVELEIDGVTCWSGRVRERPLSETDHQVVCQGWQYHLDDNLVDRVYVHTRLGDYRDQRTFLTAQLNNFFAAPIISADDGIIVINEPNGTVVPAGGAAGVTLDLGPGNYAKRCVIEWEHSNNDSSMTFYARTSDLEQATGGGGVESDFFTITLTGGASGTTAGTASTARRYVHLFLFRATGATHGADVFFRIKSCKIFRETAYESANQSVLEADEVIRDALTQAPLLNQSTSLITDGTFSIPEYLTGGPKTPRDVIQSVNAYENMQNKIGGSDLKTLVYRAKPTAPLFEVGEWSGSEFTDASISGDDIYDKAIVEGTGPDGGRIVAVRGHGHSTSRQLLKQFTAGTIQAGTTMTATAALSRSAAAGIPYAVRIGNYDVTGTLGGTFTVTVGFYSGSTPIDVVSLGTFNAVSDFGPTTLVSWIPTAARATFGVQVDGTNVTGAGSATITPELYWGATLAERREIPRSKVLPIRSAITQLVGERFGDLWLLEHRTAPFAGTLQVTGASGVRQVQNGGAVPAHVLLLHTGERIRLAHRVDPDTGGWGRDGRIAGITYRHNDRSASIQIDDRRESFERLLERYGALAPT